MRAVARAVGATALAFVTTLAVATPAAASTVAGARPAGATSPSPAIRPVPTFAYFSMSYEPQSWDRTADQPLAGRYSGGDPAVLRRQVREAKSAGVAGFLVSWRHTAEMDRRLARLAAVARDERFALGIVYEGSDPDGRPLPPRVVAAGITWFAGHYGHDPAFAWFGRPVVIWRGAGQLPTADVARVSRQVRDGLFLLASAADVTDYRRVRDYVDGDASLRVSAQPDARGHAAGLAAMARAVHDHDGLWIAPAAPGFDERSAGGHTVVPRAGGRTLRDEYVTALGSSPDAIGVVSWNGYGDNTQIEPSRRYGDEALRTLADLLDGRVSVVDPFDSSGAEGEYAGLGGPTALGLIGGFALAGTAWVVWRRRRPAKTSRTQA